MSNAILLRIVAVKIGFPGGNARSADKLLSSNMRKYNLTPDARTLNNINPRSRSKQTWRQYSDFLSFFSLLIIIDSSMRKKWGRKHVRLASLLKEIFEFEYFGVKRDYCFPIKSRVGIYFVQSRWQVYNHLCFSPLSNFTPWYCWRNVRTQSSSITSQLS